MVTSLGFAKLLKNSSYFILLGDFKCLQVAVSIDLTEYFNGYSYNVALGICC